MVEAADTGMIGVRDRALILLGFSSALRRSEIVGLDTEDCTFGKDGLTIALRRSKTDQEGAGRKIGIPYGSNPDTCPVRVVNSWIEQSGNVSGPVFVSINRHGHVQMGRLSGLDVARIIKKLASRAGLDATKYAGHSLLAGHVTSTAIAGASERSMMNQTGHRSVQMVRRYTGWQFVPREQCWQIRIVRGTADDYLPKATRERTEREPDKRGSAPKIKGQEYSIARTVSLRSAEV